MSVSVLLVVSFMFIYNFQSLFVFLNFKYTYTTIYLNHPLFLYLHDMIIKSLKRGSLRVVLENINITFDKSVCTCPMIAGELRIPVDKERLTFICRCDTG